MRQKCAKCATFLQSRVNARGEWGPLLDKWDIRGLVWKWPANGPNGPTAQDSGNGPEMAQMAQMAHPESMNAPKRGKKPSAKPPGKGEK
jgi:hypothetical protein